MHKSRLGTLVIDCRTDALDAAARWWGRALGLGVQRRFEPGDEIYRALDAEASQPQMLLQQVDHPSRVHLDIETDDIEAEADRLEALGAKRIARVKEWWVMEAPTGHRFCVVPPQRADFDEAANVWDGDPW